MSEKKLRIKAVTLLALACMTRPSNLAPNAEIFDPLSLTTSKIIFTTDQLTFHNDGSLTVVFFSIKNDSDRKGFEVRIPAGSSEASVPVVCLKHYVAITERHRPDTKPVFIGLTAPYNALARATIANIQKEPLSALDWKIRALRRDHSDLLELQQLLKQGVYQKQRCRLGAGRRKKYS